MTGPPRTSKRAAREATEAAMLDAATRLLLQNPPPDVLAALRPVEVARSCDPPRTTGAFYNIWPTHAEFRRALLNHVLSLDRFRADQQTMEAADALLGTTGADPDDVLRIAANLNFDGLKDDPTMRLELALMTRADTDADTREQLGALYDSIAANVVPRLERLLARSGRRMREPFTVQTLSVALAALVEGLHLRWLVDPDAVPDDLGPPPGVDPTGRERWSTFAAVTRVLFLGMSEPLEDPS